MAWNMHILRHFWLDACSADVATLQQVFLPYLEKLLAVMHDWRIPFTTPSHQWQFQQILFRFITLYIGKEPTTPSSSSSDLICPPLGCVSVAYPYGCPVCRQLDAFLVDPHAESADITGDTDTLEYIASGIQEKEYLRMTVLTPDPEPIPASKVRITKHLIKPEELPDQRHEMGKVKVV